MILWTIQPEKIYQSIMKNGVYRCDFKQSCMQTWKRQYDWLVAQMKQRIGKAPTGVDHPVWAWYQWEGDRKKPDLRKERWSYGWKGERFVCLEIEVPDAEVLLSDFDLWSIILLDGLVSYSEDEEKSFEARYNALSEDEQRVMKEKNWERVFDLIGDNNMQTAGEQSVQATFWELRKKQICNVRMFVAATPKPE